MNPVVNQKQRKEDLLVNGLYKVGDNVEMIYNRGTVELYSDGGTLWPDWLERISVGRWEIKSIQVAEGTVKLPEDVQGFILQKMVYTMFGGLSQVESIDLSSFDTSNVTNIGEMFMSCSCLKYLDLSSFDTSKVTNMYGMFYSCGGLTGIDLSSFDTSNVTNMSGMFCDCNNLTHLNLSGFDTSNVTDISYMFYNCRNLTDIDLGKFDASHILDMRSLFAGCRNLKTVIMDPAVNQDAKTDKIFDRCRAEIIYI